jgi:Fuc2NAc and GlcNAc transferase
MTQVFIFVLLVVLSYGGVYLIRRWAVPRQIMDTPNQRSSHSVSTPRGGGLAIVILVLGAALVYGVSAQLWKQTLVYVGVGGMVAWLGWRDDMHSLSPRLRLLLQASASVITILCLGHFKSITIPMLGNFPLGAAGIPITFLWILGLINAYNFMDGIDGISGGVAVAAGLGWMLLASSLANPLAYWIAFAIASSSLGFLGHNWSPARIFMGDVASTFLGFSFAVLPFMSAGQNKDTFLLGTMVMWVFIMDAGVTFIQRLFKGENVMAAHRSHLYQRLVIGGCKHATVSLLYIFLTVLGVLLAIGWIHGGIKAVPALTLIGLPLIWGFLSWGAARRHHAE